MKNKNLITTVFFLFIFLVSFSIELDAQRRGTKKRTRTDKNEDSRSSRRDRDDYDVSTWKDNLYYEFHMGNIGLGGSQFFMAFKPTVGYSVNKYISANLGLKGAYLFVNNFNGQADESLFDWGIAPALRFKINETFYLQGEYSYNANNTAIGRLDDPTKRFKLKKWAPFIGGGYLSGIGPNKFGIEVLFVADNEIRDLSILTDVVEFWFGFYRNF